MDVSVTSLLFHSSPDTLRFIMIDPKIVEMKVFNSLPHMLIPVVTDPKKVPGALKWLINEMEHRYETFAKVGVRNIAGFNGRSKPETDKTEAEKQEEEQLEISVPRDEGVLDEIHQDFFQRELVVREALVSVCGLHRYLRLIGSSQHGSGERGIQATAYR